MTSLFLCFCRIINNLSYRYSTIKYCLLILIKRIKIYFILICCIRYHFFMVVIPISAKLGLSLLFAFCKSIISWAKLRSFNTSFSLAYRNSKYSFFIRYISLLIRSTSYFTLPIYSWAFSSSFFIFFIWPVFSFKASLYLMSCSWISEPGCLANTFFSSKKSFSLSRIRFYLAYTSSVLAIRRLNKH